MLPTKEFLYGAAYYEEYMPYERTETDFRLMKEAGMNVIRIAESTWSTWEPEDGRFDFTHLQHMLSCALQYDIKVIVGTPTYAIPAWLSNKYPDIMSYGPDGRALYGHRQLFDLTNPDYLRHAERIIRRLMEEVKDHPAVIGYQLDNETRSAGAASPDTQKLFVAQLKKKYPDTNEFNREFGLDYWSNRIDRWEDFPDIRGTINGSLSAAYKRFLRECITNFLHWQAGIIKEYKREDQFITHNFDYSWDNASIGIQPEVDQLSAAQCMDIAGCDIYHPMQDRLDGATIAFGGAVARSLKKTNYLVLETQSQGNTRWLPYPGQLRLSAYSHIANGANSVMYWNWHSIHNAIESYWKGILSHDLTPHETYYELKSFRKEMLPIESHLKSLRKDNKAAILVDNASLTGLDEFPISDHLNYNEILRHIFDTCHKMNLECDLVYKTDSFENYQLLIVPALYSASDAVLENICHYVENGGHLLLGFKSAFSDDEIKIYPDAQPHHLTECIGATYDRFTIPEHVGLTFTDNLPALKHTVHLSQNNLLQTDASQIDLSQNDAAKNSYTNQYKVTEWMELVTPTTAKVWAYYVHPYWGEYAAVTHNSYGKGTATYVACHTEQAALQIILSRICDIAGITLPAYRFPIIVKCGINEYNKTLQYILNYSSRPQDITYIGKDGTDLLTKTSIHAGEAVTIKPWDLIIVEEL